MPRVNKSPDPILQALQDFEKALWHLGFLAVPLSSREHGLVRESDLKAAIRGNLKEWEGVRQQIQDLPRRLVSLGFPVRDEWLRFPAYGDLAVPPPPGVPSLPGHDFWLSFGRLPKVADEAALEIEKHKLAPKGAPQKQDRKSRRDQAEAKALGYLTQRPGATVTEVSRETGVPRSTLYTMCRFRKALDVRDGAGQEEKQSFSTVDELPESHRPQDE